MFRKKVNILRSGRLVLLSAPKTIELKLVKLKSPKVEVFGRGLACLLLGTGSQVPGFVKIAQKAILPHHTPYCYYPRRLAIQFRC